MTKKEVFFSKNIARKNTMNIFLWGGIPTILQRSSEIMKRFPHKEIEKNLPLAVKLRGSFSDQATYIGTCLQLFVNGDLLRIVNRCNQ